MALVGPVPQHKNTSINLLTLPSADQIVAEKQLNIQNNDYMAFTVVNW